MTVTIEELITPLARLDKELREAAETLSPEQARYLVDTYYQAQKLRIGAGNQDRAAEEAEPNPFVPWFRDQLALLEHNITAGLDRWSSGSETGRWAKSVYGIGPILASGLLAHIDPERAVTPSKIWRFAGLDNPANYQWGKGEKRPYNASLKVLCWKIGDSFRKFHNRDQCFYGHLYAARKQLELDRDAAGANAETARNTLAQRTIRDKDTRERYESGSLPAGRLDLRASRYAVKIFLAHYWEVARWEHFGERNGRPWIIEHGGHRDQIRVPNPPWDKPVDER